MRLMFLSDVHLSSKPPLARSDEPDWKSAMAKTLGNVLEIQNQHDVDYIVCAGDVFDRWRVDPELINFALDCLPLMYSIPGNHDAPGHNLNQMYRAAYQTLVKAGRLIDLVEVVEIESGVFLHPFPYGAQIKKKFCKRGLDIAVCHEFVFQNHSKHGGNNIKVYDSCPYDVMHFGDNHQAFTHTIKNCIRINTGGLMRRRVDERDYHPSVVIYCTDTRKHDVVFLDISNESIRKPEFDIFEDSEIDCSEFVATLRTSMAQDGVLSWRDMLSKATSLCEKRVREIASELFNE